MDCAIHVPWGWLEAHPGTGTWVGAAASFAAVVVALVVSGSTQLAEQRRLSAVRNTEAKAVIASIIISLRRYDTLVTELAKWKEDRIDFSMARPFLNSAASAAGYGTNRGINDAELLYVVVDTQTLMSLSEQILNSFPQNLPDVPAKELSEALNLLAADRKEIGQDLDKMKANFGWVDESKGDHAARSTA